MRTHLSPAKCYFPTHGINDHFCYIKLTCEPISSNSVSWLSPFIKICAFIWFLRQYQHEHKDCEETCHLHKTSPTNFIPACQTIKLIKLINGPGKEKSQVGPGEEGYDHPLSQERVEMSPWGKSSLHSLPHKQVKRIEEMYSKSWTENNQHPDQKAKLELDWAHPECLQACIGAAPTGGWNPQESRSFQEQLWKN